jgi:hypothetical protein
MNDPYSGDPSRAKRHLQACPGMLARAYTSTWSRVRRSSPAAGAGEGARCLAPASSFPMHGLRIRKKATEQVPVQAVVSPHVCPPLYVT